ncbi:hypothetical protein GCM10010989_19840 [Croceicoccus pelagius]|uniref:Uncharacterized protein n=1 Tax=Croceicoccus pelagius TaxID=1703341 RepID=A0A916YI47_9SPHN|nr:hypothetical protein GCM10010989_19840 [Croceicoccus pelagius]
MGTNSIDEHGTLTDQELARAVQNQDGLPLRALDRYEAHGRAPHRFADRLGISRVVLLTAEIKPSRKPAA